MEITDLGSYGTAPLPATNSAASALASDEFFTILSAQLRSQNPLEPMSETEFMGQLAQFSQLEHQAATNQTLQVMAMLQEGLAALQQLTEGANLIGQTVEYTDPATGEPAEGEVQAIRVENGLVVLDVDGTSVPLPFVTAILGRGDGE